jgi:GlpG protein
MVVILGIGSNFCEYYMVTPQFGGMSGVLYGLFGYIWIRSLCDPSSGLVLSSSTVGMMLVWFFLCLVNVIPNVANWAHGGGLFLGMLWGALPLAGKYLRS